MNDKELFLKILSDKEKYKIEIDNDNVCVYEKENLEEYEKNENVYLKIYEFNKFGYCLLNEVFQALEIDSDLV